jgi:hypothetical protein
VLALLLLTAGVGTLVRTVTMFTVAHSITLAAAALGYVPVDRAPVEAAIALSIVLLAREVVTRHLGHASLVHRKPWLVAFIFGLLHGFGFAGALGEMGLRSRDIPLALVSFNVGVEAGQIAFIAVCLTVALLWGRLTRMLAAPQQSLARLLPMRLEPVLGYALGAVATLWLLDRLPAVVGMG